MKEFRVFEDGYVQISYESGDPYVYPSVQSASDAGYFGYNADSCLLEIQPCQYIDGDEAVRKIYSGNKNVLLRAFYFARSLYEKEKDLDILEAVKYAANRRGQDYIQMIRIMAPGYDDPERIISHALRGCLRFDLAIQTLDGRIDANEISC